MAVLFTSTWNNFDLWQQQLTAIMPNLALRSLENIGNPSEIDAVFAWKPPAGIFSQLPHLKLIQSLGMGIDHLLNCPDLPTNVPIARIVDPDMGMQMAEYVLYGVLHYHRLMSTYQQQQQQQHWKPLALPKPKGTRVGILGFGQLGQAVADAILAQGFPVQAWSRTPKSHPQVTLFHGESQLEQFLATVNVLVCLLPLTSQTTGILNQHIFERLPTGAFLINVARGDHLVEADLLTALNNQQLSGALLDVFQTEPLPADHPFWHHPQIMITPHISAMTNPETASQQIIENYQRVQRGLTPYHQVNLAHGY